MFLWKWNNFIRFWTKRKGGSDRPPVHPRKIDVITSGAVRAPA